MIQLQCPTCRRSFGVEEPFNEPQVHCGHCGADFPFEPSGIDNWNPARDVKLDVDVDLDDETGSVATETMEEREPIDADEHASANRPAQPIGQTVRSTPTTPTLPLVVAMTGASGAPYAMRLLEVLLRSGRQIHLVLSPAAAQVLRDEMQIEVDPNSFDVSRFVARLRIDGGSAPARAARQLVYHHYMNWHAGIASGSFLTSGMVVCPCSMSTLGAIAGGLSTNLIQRAADVHLKERRKLVLVPREMPLNLIHLENMTRCAQAGAVILPAMPGWYHRPQSLDDLINFVVGRICDQLGVPHDVTHRWGSESDSRSFA